MPSSKISLPVQNPLQKGNANGSFLKAQLGAPTAQDYAKLEEEKRHLEQDLADARARIAVLETQVRSSRNKILNNKVLPTQLDQERECPSTLESPSDQPTP